MCFLLFSLSREMSFEMFCLYFYLQVRLSSFEKRERNLYKMI